jgi:hypothetical protein
VESSRITFRGENAHRFADAFVESKAEERKRSINKRGVRNIHRFEGDGFTQVAYERGSAFEDSWLMVSVLVERSDDRTCTVVVFVGGGGEGPFKLEEVSMRRVLRGEESVGEAGRFETVLRDVKRVAESLDLAVATEWASEGDESLTATLERKIFDS